MRARSPDPDRRARRQELFERWGGRIVALWVTYLFISNVVEAVRTGHWGVMAITGVLGIVASLALIALRIQRRRGRTTAARSVKNP